MGGYDVIALRSICANYFEQMVMPVLEEVQQTQAELRTELQQLSVAVEKKTAVHDVATLDCLETLQADVSQKVSVTDLENALAELRASSDSRAILAKLEERTANTERTVRSHAAKIAEFRDMSQELEGKANVREVPSLAQFKKLEGTVKNKANANKVPTLEQFTELKDLAESKVSAHWVPSMEQFESLARQVEKKANASNVISAPELKNIQEEIQQKANITDTPNASWIQEQLQKASACQASTQSSVDKLASVIEKKLAFLASRVQKNTEALDTFQQPNVQQAMFCYIPATACGTWAPTHSEPGGWSVQSESGSGTSEGLAPGGWAEPLPQAIEA